MNINDFLEEIEWYIGEYSKNHEIKSGNEILIICEKYYESCSNHYIFYYYKSMAYVFLKEFKQGEEELKNAIKLNNNDERIFLLRARCFEGENKLESALADYITAYEINKNCVEAILKIGFSFVQDEEFEEALIYFNKAHLLKDDHNINFALSGVYYELAQYEKSLEYINKAIEFKGDIGSYYINRALANRLLGNLENAKKDYEKAIKLEDNNPEPQYYLATLYLDVMEVWKATLILKNLIERFPNFIESYATLSRCYIEIGNMGDALDTLDKALRIDDKNIGFRYIKADILFAQENFKLAEQEYLKIIDMGEDNAFVFNSLAKLYIANESYDKGISIINKGLEREPYDIYLNRNLAHCYFYNEDYDNAIRYFTIVLSFGQENSEDYSFRGRCYYFSDRDEEAEKDYLKALELDKNDESNYFYLGYIYYYNSDYERCIDVFTKYINVVSDEVEVIQAMAECYMKLNKFEEACELLEQILSEIELFENKAQIYTQLGVCYGRLEDSLKALEYYDKALQEDGDYLLAHYNKGLIYSKNKEYENSIQCYNKVLTLDKKNHFVYYNRGVVYENLEKYNLAEQDYKKAFEINNEPALYEEIAWVCFLQKKYKEAIYNYEMAINNGIKEAYTYGNLARVYKTLSNYDVAIKYFEIALELEKNFNKSWCVHALKNLAFCYMKSEKYEYAIKWCTIAIENKAKNADIYAIKGISYMALFQEEKAINYIEKALNLGELNEFKSKELFEMLKKLKNNEYNLV